MVTIITFLPHTNFTQPFTVTPQKIHPIKASGSKPRILLPMSHLVVTLELKGQVICLPHTPNTVMNQRQDDCNKLSRSKKEKKWRHIAVNGP